MMFHEKLHTHFFINTCNDRVPGENTPVILYLRYNALNNKAEFLFQLILIDMNARVGGLMARRLLFGIKKDLRRLRSGKLYKSIAFGPAQLCSKRLLEFGCKPINQIFKRWIHIAKVTFIEVVTKY